MNKPAKIALIASSSVIGTGVIMVASYLKGKSDGFKLAHKQMAETPADLPRNTRTNQAQA